MEKVENFPDRSEFAHSPIAPSGYTDTLNDHHCNLGEEDEEEGKETEGVVGPERRDKRPGETDVDFQTRLGLDTD